MSRRKTDQKAESRAVERELRGQQRTIARNQQDLQREEKRLLALIKAKAGKEGKEACVPLVKQLTACRNNMKRNAELDSRISCMNSQQRMAVSNQNMVEVMGSVTKVMSKTNQDPEKLAKTFAEFGKNNAMMEMNEEMMNDMLLDMDADSEAENDVLGKVFSELNIEVSDKLRDVGEAKNALPSVASVDEEKEMHERLERLRN